MTDYATKSACHCCDLLLDLSILSTGQKAHCPRCGCFLTKKNPNHINRVLALSITAVIFLISSLCFPFLAFSAQGQYHQIHLIQSVSELAQMDEVFLALLMAIFILLVPALIISIVIFMYVSVKTGIGLEQAKRASRWLYLLHPWSMIEVFLIGVLVSLIKISAMADIIIGLSFWGYVLFVVSLTATFSQMDRITLWSYFEQRDH